MKLDRCLLTDHQASSRGIKQCISLLDGLHCTSSLNHMLKVGSGRLASLTFERFTVSRLRTRTYVNMVAPAGLFSNRYRLKDMPDLTGKLAIVSGGSRGIGEAATAALVQKGCEGESLAHLGTC